MTPKGFDKAARSDRPSGVLRSLRGPLCLSAALLFLVSDSPSHALTGSLLLMSGVLFSAVAIVDAAKSRKGTVERSERTGAGAVKF